MARIETDPNYTSPTFSRATAATDLFKKEDVQNLAAAVSTHDHSSGKGLALPLGAIPDGLITSAKIADGTITTADLAANASQYVLATVTATIASPTTTSPTMVDIPEMVINFNAAYNFTGLILFQGVFVTAGAGIDLGITLVYDGNGLHAGTAVATYRATAVGYQPMSLFGVVDVAAGPHTIKAQWQTSSGTATAHFIYRNIQLTEFFK